MDHKDTLHRYLKRQRADLLSKLDGLSEWDMRRPMTRTGTNLIGVLKHTASVELGYFTDVFRRPSGVALPWFEDGAERDDDFWLRADESTASVFELQRLSAELTDATIEALDLDAPGVVPWWPPERREVTLQVILVHMAVETARHAGHVDILREQIDGFAGMRPDDPMVDGRTPQEWAAHRDRIEAAARAASGR